MVLSSLEDKIYQRVLNILDAQSKGDLERICLGMEADTIGSQEHTRITDVALENLLLDCQTNDSDKDCNSMESHIGWAIHLTLEMYQEDSKYAEGYNESCLSELF